MGDNPRRRSHFLTPDQWRVRELEEFIESLQAELRLVTTIMELQQRDLAVYRSTLPPTWDIRGIVMRSTQTRSKAEDPTFPFKEKIIEDAPLLPRQ